MLNRPRPRKIVSVIKTSPSTEEVSKKGEDFEVKSPEIGRNFDLKSTETKTIETSEPRPINTIQAPVTVSDSSAKSRENSPTKSDFIIRKPVVATLRKANLPPPPSFSDSPKSNFTANNQSPKNSSNFSPSLNLTVSPPTNLSTSPKSSGEVFLDAADKAVDLIGGALLNSFKSFNLSDDKPVVFDNSKDEDNPFDDIMQKLKENKSQTKKESNNLLDEEPPASFSNSIDAKDENISIPRPPFKTTQPSSAIKAAFQRPAPQTFDNHLENSKADVVLGTDKNDYDNTKTEIETKSLEILVKNSSVDSTLYVNKRDNPVEFSSPTSENSSFGCQDSQTQSDKAEISAASIPIYDSIKSFSSPTNLESSPSSSVDSSVSSRQGFRASILKHGLSALEKIGKSTADVVVSTRNKLAEPQILSSLNHSQPVTPDFNDSTSSFYDIFQLYGGYAKLQDLQIKGIRASVSMKLDCSKQNTLKASSYDFNARMRLQREIAQILHPDRIMEMIDDSDSKNLLFTADISSIFPKLMPFNDEIECIQKLLRSLDNVLVVNDDSIINSSNRRRHIICQIATVFCGLLQQIINQNQEISLNLVKEISLLASQIIKYFQINFARNCEDHTRTDRDQQLAIKLILDISYSAVPRFQCNLLTIQ